MSTDAKRAAPSPGPTAPSHAERCRTLAARATSATLSTIARDPAGYPFGSLVAVAFDADGAPLMLLSRLAEHTQNLAAREEASILVVEPAPAGVDPLAQARMTILGPCRVVAAAEVDHAREQFLARHPEAKAYAAFSDFAMFRLETRALRYVGGFGRMSWVDAEGYRTARPDPLADAASSILAHMNDDHAKALVEMARALAGAPAATSAVMTGVDRLGFEMSVTTPEGVRSARLGFAVPVASADEVRRALVAMVKRARG